MIKAEKGYLGVESLAPALPEPKDDPNRNGDIELEEKLDDLNEGRILKNKPILFA